MADNWTPRQHEKDFVAAKLKKKAQPKDTASRDAVISGLRKEEGSYYGKVTGLPSARQRGYKEGDKVGTDEIARQATAMIDAMAKGYDPEQARQISLKAAKTDKYVIDPAETTSAASTKPSIRIQKTNTRPDINKPVAIGGALAVAAGAGYLAAGGKSSKITKEKTPEQVAKMHPVDRAAYERKKGKTVLKTAREMSSEDIDVKGAAEKADEVKLNKSIEEFKGKPAGQEPSVQTWARGQKPPESAQGQGTTALVKPRKGRARRAPASERAHPAPAAHVERRTEQRRVGVTAANIEARRTTLRRSEDRRAPGVATRRDREAFLGQVEPMKERRAAGPNDVGRRTGDAQRTINSLTEELQSKKNQTVQEIVAEAQAKPVPREAISAAQETAAKARGSKPAVKLSPTRQSVEEIKRLKKEKAKAAADQKRTPEQRAESEKKIEGRIQKERRTMIDRRLVSDRRGGERLSTQDPQEYGLPRRPTNRRIRVGERRETVGEREMEASSARRHQSVKEIQKVGNWSKPTGEVGEIFAGVDDAMVKRAQQKAEASRKAILKGKSPTSTAGSAPQPDAGSIHKATESPSRGGIDPVVAETKSAKKPGTVTPPNKPPVEVTRRAAGAKKAAVEPFNRGIMPSPAHVNDGDITEKPKAIVKRKPVVEPVPANPKGTPLSVTTQPAPIEASIPLKQKAAELAADKAEQASAGKRSRPGRRVNKVEKSLPSKPPDKVSDSQDDINKLLRDQEADLAADRANQPAPRGKPVPNAPQEVPVSVGQTHAVKTAAQKKAERDALVKSHMKKKGFTKVSAPNEAGEVATERVKPKAPKAARAKKLVPPPESPVTARSTDVEDIVSSTSKRASVAEQVASKAPRAGEGIMASALRKASKGGKALGIAGGLFAGLAVARAAQAAPAGRKAAAAATEGRSQAKFYTALTAAGKAFPRATGTVAVPVSAAATGFTLGQAAHAGTEAIKSYREASAEKKASESKYGTIAKAAETRKKMAQKPKAKKMTLDQAGSLMDKWK